MLMNYSLLKRYKSIAYDFGKILIFNVDFSKKHCFEKENFWSLIKLNLKTVKFLVGSRILNLL